MLIKIDDWFFDKVFQPIADWVCVKTGRNTFWLAATFLYVWIASVVYQNVIFRQPVIGLVFDAVFVLVFGARALSHDKKSIDFSSTLTMNKDRASSLFVGIRLIWLLGIIPAGLIDVFITSSEEKSSVMDIVALIRDLAFGLFLYFEACEIKPPPPPKKSADLEPAYAT